MSFYIGREASKVVFLILITVLLVTFICVLLIIVVVVCFNLCLVFLHYICVVMEKNLFRDNYWDQPPCRKLEVPSSWSYLSGLVFPILVNLECDSFCVKNAMVLFVFLWLGVKNFWKWFLLAFYKKFKFWFMLFGWLLIQLTWFLFR